VNRLESISPNKNKMLSSSSAENNTTPPQQPPPPSILSLPVETHADALNIMITFLRIANKRGSYTLEESAKIHTCIQMFEKPIPTPTN
jgi:hypothetical protein